MPEDSNNTRYSSTMSTISNSGDEHDVSMLSSEISNERTVDSRLIHPHYKDQAQTVFDSDPDTNMALVIGMSVGSAGTENSTNHEKMTISSNTNIARCSSMTHSSHISSNDHSSQAEQYILHATNVQMPFINEEDLHGNYEHDYIPIANAVFISGPTESLANNSNELCIVQLDGIDCSNFARTASSRTGTTEQVSSSSGSNEASNANSEVKMNDFEHKIKNIAIAAVQAERKFWIRFVVIAIVLNTMLVTSVVIAGFCGAGNCRPSHSLDMGGKVIITTQSLTPTSAPSQETFNVATPPKDNIPEGDTNLTTNSGTAVPSFDSSNSTQNDSTTIDNGNRRSVSVALLTGVAVTAEVLIVTFLFVYYRKWKGMGEKLKIQDNNMA